MTTELIKEINEYEAQKEMELELFFLMRTNGVDESKAREFLSFQEVNEMASEQLKIMEIAG